jgi:hypothetical protein
LKELENVLEGSNCENLKAVIVWLGEVLGGIDQGNIETFIKAYTQGTQETNCDDKIEWDGQCFGKLW